MTQVPLSLHMALPLLIAALFKFTMFDQSAAVRTLIIGCPVAFAVWGISKVVGPPPESEEE